MVFWDTVLCSLVESHQYYRGMCCLHVMEHASLKHWCMYEMYIYQTIWHRFPQTVILTFMTVQT
jgi:hypothetical protein